MMDALGEPQAVLVLGGSSEIALATVRALPQARLRRVVLAGRPSPALDEAVAALTAAGVGGVESVAFDARDTASHDSVINGVFDAGDIDVVLLAFGVLGDQAEAEANPDEAVEMATVNYTGAVSAGLRVAARLRGQGHGTLVVLSSVAGDRARRSNFIYGSTKAGLDAFAQGLGDALHGSGARVLVVRPGFVRTRMTTGLPEAPMTVDPDDVAGIIVGALRKGRETVYAPGPLRLVMTGLKAVPRPLFRKLPI
ncbi:MAG: decaprenylphospho-beta-D-erythro-pentofuranosid-2-ulose 2-reductase [Actinomycetales bacterium]|nr:decaprenylphospho-beta-D-erythro-pentofuranosid-2-ulose 2-reductase [Actinomycetales bacterium]